MRVELTGKRALVTGGNSGIGAAIARAFAQAGADVVVNYHSRPEDAEALAREVRIAGRRAMPIEADVADSASVQAMFERSTACACCASRRARSGPRSTRTCGAIPRDTRT